MCLPPTDFSCPGQVAVVELVSEDRFRTFVARASRRSEDRVRDLRPLDGYGAVGILQCMDMARAANIAALEQRGDGLAGGVLPRESTADSQPGGTGIGF